MAIAKIEITCTECGCTFTHRKECHSRREADSYEAWAASNVTVCPDCRRKQQANQQAAIVADTLAEYGMELPTLTGASDKQIAYAQSVRTAYLTDNIKRVAKYCRFQQHLANSEEYAAFAAAYAEQGITVEDAIAENIKAMQLTCVQTMLTATSAREILDAKRH